MSGAALESDEVLVALARGGEREAFAELVQRHIGPLYSFAHRIVGDGSVADDLVQESFEKAWANLGQFGGRSRFRTWLFQICRNRAINWLARVRPRLADGSDVDLLRSTRAQPVECVFVKERGALLQWSLDSVGPEFREVLVLHYIDELTYEEISEILAVPVGTVRSRLHRGRARLKELLTPHLREKDSTS